MSKPPAFQWYPKDADTDENVRGMDDAEYGFYHRCLNHAWINDGLPGDLPELARIMGRPIQRVERYWVRVGRCFQIVDGRFRNSKQEAQRTEAKAFQEKRREAANARWGNKQAECKPDASALHVESSASSSASAPANTEEKTPSESKRKRATTFTETKMPDEWRWFPASRGWSDSRIAEEFERFRDYWSAKSGRDACKTDWLATWRNWIRNAKEASPLFVAPKRGYQPEVLALPAAPPGDYAPRCEFCLDSGYLDARSDPPTPCMCGQARTA